MIARRSFLRLFGLAPLALVLKPPAEPEMIEFRFSEGSEYSPVPQSWIDALHKASVDPPIMLRAQD